MRTAILTLGKTVKLQVIRRLCNKLLMIMLNCWRVNESWICWHHRNFNPEVKCCVCDEELVGTWRRWIW